MKSDDTLYESIDLYLTGQLEGEALADFTEKLQSDTEFSTLVQNQKAANDIIVGNRLAMVKQMMDADFKSKDSGGGAGKWWLGGLLGSSILIGGMFYVSNKTKSEITFAHTTTEGQKIVSDTRSSQPDPKHTEQSTASLPQTYPQHLRNAEDTHITTPSTELHAQTDIPGNAPSDLQNQNLNNVSKSVTDTSHTKNVLADQDIQKRDVCLGVIIDGILIVDAACTNKNDGEIHIKEQSIKGGRSPYTYVLVDPSNDTTRQKTSAFTSLSKGQYKLFFEDANACRSAYRKPLYINEKSCASGAQSFSPHAGERFNYPVSGDSDAEVTIYNRGGQVVHKTHLAKGVSEFWDGTNQNGQLLPTGMYIYIIEYVSGTKETGEVVIF